MTLDPKDIRRRLAFIRHLHRVGVEQSEQPEPMKAASVLTFHDAVELFLHLSFEHLDVSGGTPQFMEYWDRIGKAAAGIQLSGKVSMERLNRARANLKHAGVFPSSPDIDGFRASVTSFLDDNTRLVFSLDFDRISLIDLVISAEVRTWLENAQASLAKNDLDEASLQIAIAFDKLVNEYDVVRDLVTRRPPFAPGRRYLPDALDRDAHGRDEERRWAAASIARLVSAVRVMALGLDYRRFRHFEQTTPHIDRTVGGQYIPVVPKTPPTRADCESNLAFVIECALRVQQ